MAIQLTEQDLAEIYSLIDAAFSALVMNEVSGEDLKKLPLSNKQIMDVYAEVFDAYQKHVEGKERKAKTIHTQAMKELVTRKEVVIDQVKHALSGVFSEHTLRPGREVSRDLVRFREKADPKIVEIAEEQMLKHKNIKISLNLVVILTRGETKSHSVHLVSKPPQRILRRAQIPEAINTMFAFIDELLDKWTNSGSGWRLDEIKKLVVKTIKYSPFRGSSYIDLPPALKAKKAIINVKNDDNECFRWAVLSALFPADKNADRVTKYRPHKDFLKFAKINFPVEDSDYKRFELQNHIGINVFGYEDGQVYPLFVSETDYRRQVDLLLIGGKNKNHYCWIKDLAKLVSADISKNEHKRFICRSCLHAFTRQDLLDEHKRLGCDPKNPTVTMLPKPEEAFMEFKNYHHQLKVPFIIYADFEALTVPIPDEHEGKPDDEKPATRPYQKHVACGFGYKVVSEFKKYEKQFPFRTYRGENAARVFIDTIKDDYFRILDIMKLNNPMIITDDQEEEFRAAVHCHICKKPLEADRVRDHCHITGLYRGPAHNICNINYNYSKTKIPVVFHNLRGYDAHLIIKELKDDFKQVTLIPNNMEKYISFSLGRLQFIDSFQFVLTSLESLVANLYKSTKGDHAAIKSAFKHLYEGLTDSGYADKIELLLRKGVYPYDYMDSFERFNETSLPPLPAFYSKLNDEEISPTDYAHAQAVWGAFGCKNMGDYHDLYLKGDILQLADVFESFRDVSMKHYGLDPAHYFTSPGMSWDAGLKMTGIRLDLFNDQQLDMYQFCERAIRGGICMASLRHAKANNKDMGDRFDPAKPSKYVMYVDANNLYGWGMSQSIPYAGQSWEDPDIFTSAYIMSLEDDGERGYLLEVDLDYPDELHDSHNDYPLAPERMLITNAMLSQTQLALQREFKMKEGTVEKLVPNLNNKRNYIVHYRALKLYLELGLKLTRVHRVLSMLQKPWIKQYIDFNTEQRTKAKNDFEKDFFKLMNNSFFGKTMEDVRGRVDVRLISDAKKAMRLAAKPTYLRSRVLSDDLVAFHMLKKTCKLAKPIYCGGAVLDLSKQLMYDFYYNTMKATYGDRLRMCYTDTDSLVMEIETEDFYADVLSDRLPASAFDFADYPKDHRMHDRTNGKVLGKFKDEMNGKQIEEFVALRSKMYSVKSGTEEKKKAKGIKKCVVKKGISHADYLRCITGQTTTDKRQTAKMNMIRSKDHTLYSLTIRKVGLCLYDDKRYFEDASTISTLAHGHYKIREENARQLNELVAELLDNFTT